MPTTHIVLKSVFDFATPTEDGPPAGPESRLHACSEQITKVINLTFRRLPFNFPVLSNIAFKPHPAQVIFATRSEESDANVNISVLAAQPGPALSKVS